MNLAEEFSFIKRNSLSVAILAVVLIFNTLISDARSNKSIRITSTTQTHRLLEGKSSFAGNVKVAMEGTEVVGPHADFKMDDNGQPDKALFTDRPKMTRKGSGAKQTIQADTLRMELKSGSLQAKGRVLTQVSDDGAKDDVSIQSDSQLLDQEKGIMRAIGNVTVRKGDMVATSPEAIIFMSDSGAAEKALFIKGARLIQGDQEMNAETITVKIDSGDIYAEKNSQSIVTSKDSKGNPTKVKVQSHLQELDKSTGTLLANGNAVVYYEDYVAKGPKAVFYRIDDKLDRIVMTGRAQIEDPDRKVVGDTVVIKVDPRQFNAQGNVTTFIKSKKKESAASSSSRQAAGGTGKPGNGSNDGSVKAWNEELMIEKMTKGSGEEQ